jgi:hypothetical protein
LMGEFGIWVFALELIWLYSWLVGPRTLISSVFNLFMIKFWLGSH